MRFADARRLPWRDGTVDHIVTSPPYWGQRDYGFPGQIGMEGTYEEYLSAMRDVAAEMWRVLKPDGTVWLNVGDTYNTRAIIRPSAHQGGLGHDTESTRLSWSEARDRGLVRYSARQPGLKDKDLMGLPWRLVNLMVEDGWFLRCDVIWFKTFCTPENADDRPSRVHEYVFLLSKSPRYYYDKSVEGARSSVWEIAPSTGHETHSTTFPDELVRRCILTATKPGWTVADPFAGSGTVGRVALELGRRRKESDADRGAGA